MTVRMFRIAVAIMMASMATSPAMAQPAPPRDIAMLVPDTLWCYQNLETVHAPDTIGSSRDVVKAIEAAAKGDFGLLDALPSIDGKIKPKVIGTRKIRHPNYASAVSAATAAHNIHGLRVLYAVCHARDSESMSKLYIARDEQVMSAAHHVVECYLPKRPRTLEADQCMAAPQE